MTRTLALLILIPIFLLPMLLLATQAVFDASQGLVEVQVRIDNRVNGRFGIDTGADRLYINKSFAEKNYFAKEGIPDQRQVVGIDGTSGGYFVSLRSLEIGKERMHNVKAMVVDFDKLIGNQSFRQPDGLIGFDILKRMYVTIDYPNRLIDLQLDRPRFLAGRQFERVPFKIFKHLILVDVTFDDGQKRPMILDYCASHTAITPDLARELGLSTTVNSRSRLDLSIDGVIRSDGVESIVMDFEAFRKSLPRAKFEGILGGSFLWQHKITVNYKQNEIYLHKTDIASK